MSANGGVFSTNFLTFGGANGARPASGLIQGSDGNLYGTTTQAPFNNSGHIFKLTRDGILTPLAVFDGTNTGRVPVGTLCQADDGKFYGTAYYGGAYNLGTVFQADTNGSLVALCSFDGTNGSHPAFGVVQGADHNFYGTTTAGTVFRYSTNGTLTTLMSFNGTNGASPGPLITTRSGDIYGTAEYGALGYTGLDTGNGLIFKISLSGTVTVVLQFPGKPDGFSPTFLTEGSDGNLYGVTLCGGALTNTGPYGRGTFYRLTPSGTLTTLASFSSSNSPNPEFQVWEGTGGNFFGLTQYGGNNNGSIFQITPAGDILVLYRFSDFSLACGLLLADDGNLYAVTQQDGVGLGNIVRVSAPMPPVLQGSRSGNGAVQLTSKTVAGQTYQSQFTTDLSSTNWINLGTPVVATNGLMKFSDLATDPQRFYRLVLLP